MSRHDEAKSLFTIFLMCLEITPFRASAGRKIAKQPILVKVQGTSSEVSCSYRELHSIPYRKLSPV
jgi:hypothetical protein